MPKQLAQEAVAQYDLNGTALPGVAIDLGGTFNEYAEPGVAHRVIVVLRIGGTTKPVVNGATLTVTPKIGTVFANAKTVLNKVEAVTTDSTIVQFETEPILLNATQDTLLIYLHSDNAGDTDVDVIATVVEIDSFDANGRVDLSKWLGTAAETPSTAGRVATDVVSVGNATPISKANIQTEAEEAIVAKFTEALIANLKSFMDRH